MDSEFWISVLINSVALGGAYTLFALGLSVIFGVLQIVNFAQGEFYMLGGYLILLLVPVVGLWVALGAASIGLFALGVLIYYGLFRYFSQDSLFEAGLATTLGISLFLQNVVLALSGGSPKMVRAFSGSFSIGGAVVPTMRMVALCGALVALGATGLFLTRTKYGLAIRAFSQNRSAAMVAGIPHDRIGALAVGLGLALAGVAAALLAPLYAVYPTMGVTFVIKAFAVVIIGGLGSLKGTAIAAFILSFTENFAGALGSALIQDVAALVLVIGILLVRPQGMFTDRLRAS